MSLIPARVFTKSTLSVMCGQMLAIAAGALLSIVLARVLGAQGYGDFAFTYTLLSIAVIPCKMGLDTTAMKLTAAYERTGDFARLHGLFRYATGRTVAISATVSIPILIALQYLGDELPASLHRTLVAGSFAIPILAALHILQYFLYGLRRYFLAQFPESIARPLILAIIVLLGTNTAGVVDASTVMQWNVGLTFAVSGFALVWVIYYLPRGTFSTAPTIDKAQWYRTGKAMLMISSLNFILSQTDMVLLGTLGSTYDAGLYSAAAKIAAVTGFFYVTVNSMAAPMISRAFAAGDRSELRRLASICTSVIVITTLILCLLAILFGRELLSLFGDDFIGAYGVLILLAVSQLFKSLSGIGGFLLTMTHLERLSARFSLLSAMLNFFIAVMLIPSYGAIGAAIGTLVATSSWSMAVILVVRKSVHLPVSDRIETR